MKPQEITEDPKFFVEGLSSTDVSEGVAENGWFVSAASALSREKHLFNKVRNNNYPNAVTRLITLTE